MLRQDNHMQLFEVMEVDFNYHKIYNHWSLTECKDWPFGTKTIMVIWSCKCKRFSDGMHYKHKVCICAHGGQQTCGKDYWETYAPVVI